MESLKVAHVKVFMPTSNGEIPIERQMEFWPYPHELVFYVGIAGCRPGKRMLVQYISPGYPRLAPPAAAAFTDSVPFQSAISFTVGGTTTCCVPFPPLTYFIVLHQDMGSKTGYSILLEVRQAFMRHLKSKGLDETAIVEMDPLDLEEEFTPRIPDLIQKVAAEWHTSKLHETFAKKKVPNKFPAKPPVIIKDYDLWRRRLLEACRCTFPQCPPSKIQAEAPEAYAEMRRRELRRFAKYSALSLFSAGIIVIVVLAVNNQVIR